MQIRLRTLLLAVAVLALCLSAAGNRAHHERRVIAALRARGALLHISVPTSWPVIERLYYSRIGKWILETLGEGYLEQIRSIHLPASHELAGAKSLSPLPFFSPEARPGDDADLEAIGSLPWTNDLLSIDLSGTRVTDAGLRHLASLRDLSKLELRGTDIDGRGLSYLRQLTKLGWLGLESTNINDAGLQSLPRLPNLDFLLLQGTRITDTGIQHLSGLPRLMVLGLDGTAVTGRGFKGFALGSTVRLTISLADCPVDDGGLRQVVSVPNLSKLDLSHTRVTDAGMEYLEELVRSDGSVCEVYIRCTSITDVGLLRLRGAKGRLVLHVGGTAVTKAAAAEVTRRHSGYTVCLGCGDCEEAAETGQATGPIRVASKDTKHQQSE